MLGQLVCTNVCELSGLGDFHHGLVLDADEFVGCVRFLLVGTGSTEPTVLLVTPALVDLCAPLASSCVKIRTTRGPFAVS